jgi:hypothetical protein
LWCPTLPEVSVVLGVLCGVKVGIDERLPFIRVPLPALPPPPLFVPCQGSLTWGYVNT